MACHTGGLGGYLPGGMPGKDKIQSSLAGDIPATADPVGNKLIGVDQFMESREGDLEGSSSFFEGHHLRELRSF